jgi:hypothetical protein
MTSTIRPLPTLIPPDPGLIRLCCLFLEKYEALAEEDRVLYRELVRVVANPPLTVTAEPSESGEAREAREARDARIRRESRRRCLDEIEAISKGSDIESGVGSDVVRVFALALARRVQS